MKYPNFKPHTCEHSLHVSSVNKIVQSTKFIKFIAIQRKKYTRSNEPSQYDKIEQKNKKKNKNIKVSDLTY